MTSQKIKLNNVKTTAVFSAVWAGIEISLTPILSTVKFPLRGFVLSIFAVVILVAAGKFVDKKGNLFSIGIACATLKFALTGHFSIAAVFAVILQGLIAELIIKPGSTSKIRAVLTGTLILTYTFVHGLLLQTLYFGKSIFDVYGKFLSFITGSNDENLLIYLLYFLSVLYFICGAFAGYTGFNLSEKINKQLQINE